MINAILTKINNNLFKLVVVLPLTLVSIFQLFLAEDEFEVTTSVIVKENQQSAGPSLPGFAGALFDYGSNTSAEDAYVLKEYMESTTFIDLLEKKFDLSGHYSSKGFPLFQRLSANADVAKLRSYLGNRMVIHISADTAIITVAVRSFDSSFSKQVLDYAIELAEQRINMMSSVISESKMALARGEFEKAEKQFREAKTRLLEFQTTQGFVDSSSEIGTRFSRLDKIRSLIISRTLELETARQNVSQDSFRIIGLEDEVRVLKEQLEILESSLVGDLDNSSLQIADDFNQIKLDVEFELNKYTASLAAFQQAQLEVSQQQKFLLIAAPSMVLDEVAYPDPVVSILTTLIVCGLLALLCKLVVSSVMDHTV